MTLLQFFKPLFTAIATLIVIISLIYIFLIQPSETRAAIKFAQDSTKTATREEMLKAEYKVLNIHQIDGLGKDKPSNYLFRGKLEKLQHGSFYLTVYRCGEPDSTYILIKRIE